MEEQRAAATSDRVVKDGLSVEGTLEPSSDPQGGAGLRKVQGRRLRHRT